MRKLLSVTILLILFCGSGLAAQDFKNCNEIKVDVKVENANNRLSNGKIILNFQEADYEKFKLFLFSENRLNNRLDFVGDEINDLSNGNYTLIIQGKDNEKFCPKQFKLKLEKE
jgi:hypothetical protein